MQRAEERVIVVEEAGGNFPDPHVSVPRASWSTWTSPAVRRYRSKSWGRIPGGQRNQSRASGGARGAGPKPSRPRGRSAGPRTGRLSNPRAPCCASVRMAENMPRPRRRAGSSRRPASCGRACARRDGAGSRRPARPRRRPAPSARRRASRTPGRGRGQAARGGRRRWRPVNNPRTANGQRGEASRRRVVYHGRGSRSANRAAPPRSGGIETLSASLTPPAGSACLAALSPRSATPRGE